MNLPSPIAVLAGAVHHAALVALPEIQYQRRDLSAMRGWTTEKRLESIRDAAVPMKDATRRPEDSECEVYAMFTQPWGSTALGFGGIGGAAMTSAYTTVVAGPQGHLAVYWNGRFAYLIDRRAQKPAQARALTEDLANRITASRMEAVVRYGAVPGDFDA
jgi:hypothetical protein